ncbi:hypothetical protein AVR70_03455 [Escherichia coli]|nr:hypothetical protein AVR70_03455 [Escherichia coli]
MTGGATVRTFTWTMAVTGFYRVPLSSAQAAIFLLLLVLRYRTMPPFTAATVSCFTICLNN